MEDGQCDQVNSAGACEVPTEIRLVRTIKHQDTTYEIFIGPCSQCGTHPIFRVMRSCGYSFSVYQISGEDYENIDHYVEQLHASFVVDVATKLYRLRHTVQEFNSRGFFEGIGIPSFRVRLIDKARLLLSHLSQKGLLQHIVDNADNDEDDLSAAFLLGCLATENFWLQTHLEAITEGYALIEGRTVGRPRAIAARRRQGRRTRTAVIQAATQVYGRDPTLRRNDSRAASAISAMKLPSLRKRDGTFLGTDAIIKHLRIAHREGKV
jgi:hypothetical protein